MQYYLKVTKNNVTNRLVLTSKPGAEALRNMLNAVAEDEGYKVDQRIYEHNGVLQRTPAEVNASARILRKLQKAA